MKLFEIITETLEALLFLILIKADGNNE